uniref:Uncharacterized protein n=1 Tax=Meloidogyne hapla TaxID=6305 RepID=A0A1I8B7D3_MELHA
MACVKFLSSNKESFLVSKEWNEFKNVDRDLAFRLLESSALIDEKQIVEKQIDKKEFREEQTRCPRCQYYSSSPGYSPCAPRYYPSSPRISYN